MYQKDNGRKPLLAFEHDIIVYCKSTFWTQKWRSCPAMEEHIARFTEQHFIATIPATEARQKPQNSAGFATRRYFTKKVIISVLAVQATLGSAINLALNCATQNTLTWLDLCKNNSDFNKHCSKWKGYAKESENIPLLIFIVLMWAFCMVIIQNYIHSKTIRCLTVFW